MVWYDGSTGLAIAEPMWISIYLFHNGDAKRCGDGIVLVTRMGYTTKKRCK